MKWWFYIGCLLIGLAMMVAGCTPPGPLSEGERISPDSPAAARHPLLEEEGLAHTTSPRPSPPGEGVASRALESIDSLMWWRADSALKVMMEFAGSDEADGMDVFEGYYCQVLVAELLYKNYYKQSNRKDLLKAVHYFDSIVGMDGADVRGVSPQRGAAVRERDAFLAARAHYINGVGVYERDSVVAACREYLKALEIVEMHFPGIETQDVASLQVEHLPRFMGLTYGRLAELFSGQFMQEPAIVCCKKALAYDRIEISSPLNQSSLLILLGKQYAKLNQNDSVSYYCNEALQRLPDTNNAVYRDLVSQLALLNYDLSKDAEASIVQLKRMLAQTSDENEKMARISTIGSIYCDDGQYDSALVYLVPMFENKDNAVRQRVAASYLHEIYQSKGDTVKAAQFAVYLAENTVSQGESNAQVSQLNELFQQHLQWEQEKALALERLEARRRNLWIGGMVALLAIVGLAVAIVTRRSHKKRLEAQEAEVQRRLDEASQQMETERAAHRLEKASMSGRLKRSNEELRELKDQIRQQNDTAPKPETQAASFAEEPICRLIMERVNEGQFKAQMDCKLYQDYALGKEQVTALREAADRHFGQFTSRLAKAYPDLTRGDLDYCCLYLLGLSDADVAALMQRAYNTVSERNRKMKAIFGTEEPLSVTLKGFADRSASV